MSHSEAVDEEANSSFEAPHRSDWEDEDDEGEDVDELLLWRRKSCKMASVESQMDCILARLVSELGCSLEEQEAEGWQWCSDSEKQVYSCNEEQEYSYSEEQEYFHNEEQGCSHSDPHHSMETHILVFL